MSTAKRPSSFQISYSKRNAAYFAEDYRRLFRDCTSTFFGNTLSSPFSTAYFGLLRVGEITAGSHPILVQDVQIASNKNKILLILRTSKTHGLGNKPQMVKISSNKIQSNRNQLQEANKFKFKSEFCPYGILRSYINIRPKFRNANEPFFVFSDRSHVTPEHMRKTLKMILKCSGFHDHLYTVQSFRAGRAVDLFSMNVSIESVKSVGRWASNSVFTYLKY